MNSSLQAVRDALARHGIEAEIDPVYLNPPCIHIGANSIQKFSISGECLQVRAEIYLILPDYGVTQVIEEFEPWLRAVIAVLVTEGYSIENVLLQESVVLPGSGASPLPAYKIEAII